MTFESTRFSFSNWIARTLLAACLMSFVTVLAVADRKDDPPTPDTTFGGVTDSDDDDSAGDDDDDSAGPSCPIYEGTLCGEQIGGVTGWLYSCTSSVLELAEECTDGCQQTDIFGYAYCVGTTVFCYPDNDGDGYGNQYAAGQDEPGTRCPWDMSEDNTDCDDNEWHRYPGHEEVCDTIDNDCDYVVDEGGDSLCDDGLYCNGTETCEGADGCAVEVHCPAGIWCDEETDSCYSDMPWVDTGGGYGPDRMVQTANGDFIGGGSQLFLSDDHAASWTQVAGSMYVSDLLVADSGTILAASNDSVYRSSDGGWYWEASPYGTEEVRTLFQSSNGDILAGAYGSQVCRSSNDGVWWSCVELPSEMEFAEYDYVYSFAQASNGDLFAGTQDGGVFISTDGGATWAFQSDINDFAVNRPDVHYHSYFYWDCGIWSLFELADGRLLAATIGGVYTSSDDGLTWDAAGDMGSEMSAFAALQHQDGTIFVGARVHIGVYEWWGNDDYDAEGFIYRSTDGGATWDNYRLANSEEVYDLLESHGGDLFASAVGDYSSYVAKLETSLPITCYQDDDADGHGQPGVSMEFEQSSCPAGWALFPDDCNDVPGAPSWGELVYPGNAEVCDGLDNNCDGWVDEGEDALCDDGACCNGSETCGGASGCQPGTPIDCDDGGDCTDDVCNPDTCWCDHIANDAYCDDGLFCNGVEYCDDWLGVCVYPGESCPDNGYFCDGVESCDEDANQCVSSGNPCPDDGIFCNGPGECYEWSDSCGQGPVPACDDGVECTSDFCNDTTDQCQNVPNDGNCSDWVFCNGDEICDPVSGCQASPGRDCDDGFPCTVDSCNEGDNRCDNVPNDSLCDDGVVCTDDFCNPSLGGCTYMPNQSHCDDRVFCNGDEICDPVSDCQPGTPVNCDDGFPCTDDSCNEEVNECQNVPNDSFCDDGLWCNGAETCGAIPVAKDLAGFVEVDPNLKKTDVVFFAGDKWDSGFTYSCQAGTAPCDPVTQTCNEANDICEDAGVGTLSINVFLHGYFNGSTHVRTPVVDVELIGTSTYTIADQVIGTDGSLEIDLDAEGVPAGDYDVVIRSVSHLDIASADPVTMPSLAAGITSVDFTSAANVECGAATLYDYSGTYCMPAGDGSGDGRVGLADYQQLRVNWNGANPACDLDGDGTCRLSDYQRLRQAWNTVGCAP